MKSEMKIKYLNGNRLYHAFLAGGNAVIQDQKYLDRINVFPVPDADTGTNLASTMRSIAEGASAHRSIKETLRSLADTALTGARGNSGIIFAQFLHGVSREVENQEAISTKSFGEAVKSAVKYAYKAMASPVEGTMLTVIRDWAEAVYQQRTRMSDFAELLTHSLASARQSLKDTPKKLKVLAKAGVVDAGAKGFVDFLEGIAQFLSKGKLGVISRLKPVSTVSEKHVHADRSSLRERYCTEALLVGTSIDLDAIRGEITPFGSSAIVAGGDDKARIHIHTDRPSELFKRLKDFGATVQIKVDDMFKQYEASHKRKADIALVTDTACDLPADLMDEHQIQIVPFVVSFGESLFLDKLTLSAEHFYSMLPSAVDYPKSSQPSTAQVQSLLTFLSGHYSSILVITIGDKLSGMFKSSSAAVDNLKNRDIRVLDSRNISATQGLIVLRAAEAIQTGKSYEEVIRATETWIGKTRILVDVQTLKYMVRSGRVSPMKGRIAKLLNLKPIISLDDEGKSVGLGKSFSRRGNMQKIIRMSQAFAQKKGLWKYAIVHAGNPQRAQVYARELEEAVGMKPAYIMEVSPVIGVHAGLGAVAVALMAE